MSINYPSIIWEEVDSIDDFQGHGAAVYYGPEGDKEKSIAVAFLKDLQWLRSSSYNVIIETLCPRSAEYVIHGLDGKAIAKELQIAVYQYLQGSKAGMGSISEHLWLTING